MSYIAPIIPENAPFTAAQRAWLNGWLAAYLGPAGAANAPASSIAPAAAPEAVEDFPWHDPSVALDERLRLAEGRAPARLLMAAMAQLDCGQCGYLCETYAEALASGAEKSLTRCVPGGKETARVLKELIEAPPVATRPASRQPSPPPGAEREGPAAQRREGEVGAGARGTAPARFDRALKLNRDGSEKDTRHVVFRLDRSDLAYEVGDSFGVHAANCPELVEAVIERLGGRGGDDVDCPDGTRCSLREALTLVCDIARPSDEAVEVLASRAPDQDESQRLQALAEGYPGAQPEDADLLDLLLAFPSARPPVQELVSALGVLQPRLYSIASSPKMVRGEVHLTVAAVRYEKHGRRRKGVASTFLAERAAPGAAVPAFIRRAHDFRLPPDHDAPIIMIGPGTGVAPFRAFLQERRAVGARGRNWLFFGDQHRASDFLYEAEFAAYHRDGLLAQLDLAFSRDQRERVYVQHRMRERSAELWSWLAEGAHLFICGAQAMARDVDAALAAIIARQGKMSLGAAKTYLATLARQQRYQRDVY
ncbi:MAG TPA: sulfite reductase subunit alpha [Stellaceae bacterium]|nr:sulfite reductase subunit alpha [Stellaceae bacterium]